MWGEGNGVGKSTNESSLVRKWSRCSAEAFWKSRFVVKDFDYDRVCADGCCLLFVLPPPPQNDKSTNNVKVIGGDELSSLSGKVSLVVSVRQKHYCLSQRPRSLTFLSFSAECFDCWGEPHQNLHTHTFIIIVEEQIKYLPERFALVKKLLLLPLKRICSSQH